MYLTSVQNARDLVVLPDKLVMRENSFNFEVVAFLSKVVLLITLNEKVFVFGAHTFLELIEEAEIFIDY
jgi:hypothetical protein